MARKFLLHKKDVFIKKDVLDRLMIGKYKAYKTILEDMRTKHGVDISYKGFFNLLTNKASWKLLYAMSLVDIMETDINTLFELRDVDVDDKLKKSLELKNKYSIDS